MILFDLLACQISVSIQVIILSRLWKLNSVQYNSVHHQRSFVRESDSFPFVLSESIPWVMKGLLPIVVLYILLDQRFCSGRSAGAIHLPCFV